MNESKFAPVVLFVYSRPLHTKKTIDALLANPESINTDLIVYSDAAKTEKDLDAVDDVRALLQCVSGFKSITIHNRETNHGLARNIIDGVTDVCEKFGRAIVLEDDIVVSTKFLDFMNSALTKYKYEQKVWHISGWNYPVSGNEYPDTFFWRVMNCWGWATWDDRWKFFDKCPEKLVNEWSKDSIDEFNLDGEHDFWQQIVDNENGNLNTWAVFWYATIFKAQGLCLNPSISYVSNIGNDGSGENCGSVDIYKTELNQSTSVVWPTSIEEDVNMVIEVKKFMRTLHPSFILRVIRKVKRLLA